MRILIVGAAGMVGRKLTERLIESKSLGGKAIDAIYAVDVVKPAFTAGGARAPTVMARQGNIADAATVDSLIDDRPDVVFHLAAVVSGEAEADFDKGYAINMDGTRHLLEAIRKAGDGYRPRLVFTSSIAVFGTPFPDIIDDSFVCAPLTSYGTQKAIGELLLNDYSRKGFVDGVGIRLPTIVVRPGRANMAASSFFSAIIREPLAGREAVLPVDESVRHWVASPQAAVGFLLHAATMASEDLGDRRCLTMPGLSITVAEMIEALRRVAGDEAASLIRREPDPRIATIVGGWPREFASDRAETAGFSADTDFDAIVRAHIAETEQSKL